MSPEDVKALRTRLRATTKDLAHALGIEPATLTAWERGEEFPTKRYVELMARLDEKGADAFPRLPTKLGAKKKGTDPMSLLADPATWMLVRKILAHTDLREAVTKLAANYDDPHTS
jgi:transcriptional regulator with XRE-family HTH domain